MSLARIETPLKRVLDEEGRRQTWLADRLGVDSRQVWNWVHGLHQPEQATRDRIAEILGRTTEELFPPDAELEAA